MGLISVRFFMFSAAVILLYYLFPFKKYQWTVLLAASWCYYLLICNKYIIYILITTVTTYLGALLTENIGTKGDRFIKENKENLSKDDRKRIKEKTRTKKKSALACVLIFNFGILAFLKYFGFAAELAVSCLGKIGLDLQVPDFKLLAPIGISFYTFQSMGYVIDVFRGKVKAERNFCKLALFVSFFPQIVQGPIGIYSQLAHQLYEPKSFKYENMKNGLILLSWGVFKKLVIADRAAKVISFVTADSLDFRGTYIIFTVLLYAAQLYADFSGGIDVCRGIAEIMGITMGENFRRPYFSKTLTEYWHRWHISLGDWLRNYLFYPISLSKPFLKMGKSMKSHRMKHLGKVFPTALASLITFVVIGIWHGAQMKYAAFGLWNGLVIMISSLMKPVTDKITDSLRINRESHWYTLFSMCRTFVIVLVGYYFDIAKSLKDALSMIYRSVFDFHLSDLTTFACLKDTGVDKFDYLIIFLGCAVIFTVSVIQERSGKSIRELLSEKKLPVQWLVYLSLIVVTAIFGQYGPGTQPSDFIYMQF